MTEFKPIPTYAKQYFPGCPYCALPRIDEQTTAKAGELTVKVITYQCGTTLTLKKYGNHFKGSKFDRKCGGELDIAEAKEKTSAKKVIS